MANNTPLFYFALVILSLFDSIEARSSVIREHVLSNLSVSEADASTAHEDKEAAAGNRDTGIVYAEQTGTQKCTLNTCLACVTSYDFEFNSYWPYKHYKFCVGGKTDEEKCWCPTQGSWWSGCKRRKDSWWERLGARNKAEKVEGRCNSTASSHRIGTIQFNSCLANTREAELRCLQLFPVTPDEKKNLLALWTALDCAVDQKFGFFFGLDSPQDSACAKERLLATEWGGGTPAAEEQLRVVVDRGWAAEQEARVPARPRAVGLTQQGRAAARALSWEALTPQARQAVLLRGRRYPVSDSVAATFFSATSPGFAAAAARALERRREVREKNITEEEESLERRLKQLELNRRMKRPEEQPGEERDIKQLIAEIQAERQHLKDQKLSTIFF